MEPGMLALLGRTISLMENLGFLWVVQTGFELDLWRELAERRSLEDLAALHPTWDKVLLDHWLEQAVCQELLTKDNLSYKVSKLGRAVQTYRTQGLEAMFQEFVRHWNPGFAKLPELLSRQEKKLHFKPEMEEELISQASLASEPFVWPFLRHKCQKSKWQRVLDIGCGEGLYLDRLLESCPTLRGVGIELNPVVADRARNYTRPWGSRLEIICKNALDVGEDLGTFDACLLNNNIYFFSPEERKRLLNNLKRLLQPGGEVGILSALRQNQPQFGRVFPTQVSRNLMSFFIACHDGFEGLPNEDEIRELLLATGYTRIEVTPLPFLVSHYFFARTPN